MNSDVLMESAGLVTTSGPAGSARLARRNVLGAIKTADSEPKTAGNLPISGRCVGLLAPSNPKD